MSQAFVRKVRMSDMMRKPAFSQGMKDAAAGLDLYERYNQLKEHDQFAYERGRQFYFATGMTKCRRGNGVSRGAVETYSILRKDKVIL